MKKQGKGADIKSELWDWRDGSVQSAYFFHRKPRFGSQHPQLPVAPVPGDPMPFSGLCWHLYAYGTYKRKHTCIYTYIFKTYLEL